MTVNVLYFGVLREMMGGVRAPLELEEGGNVGDLVARVRGTQGGAVWGSIAVAVNREYAGLTTVLRDGDEVALLPPVSGGVQESQVSGARPGAPGSLAGGRA